MDSIFGSQNLVNNSDWRWPHSHLPPHHKMSACKHQSLSNTLHRSPLGYYSSRTNLKPTLSSQASPQKRGNSTALTWCETWSARPNTLSFSLSPGSSQTRFPWPLSEAFSHPSPHFPPPSFPLHFTHCNLIGWKCSFFHLPFPTSWKSEEKEPTQIKEFQVCVPPTPFSFIHKADY